MIKQTFSTLKKNPSVFLVFFAAALLYGAALIGVVFLLMPQALSLDSQMQFDQTSFLITYFSTMGIILFIYLLFGFLVLPVLGNYIYEICTGKPEKGWYKRGLKRGWWKVVVLGLLLIGVFFGIATVIGILMMILSVISQYLIFIAFILYIIIAITLNIYLLIAFTAIMAEDSFSVALSNTFKVGNRYFFRLLGTAALFIIPFYIVSFIFAFASTNQTLIHYGTNNYLSTFSVGYWVFFAFCGLYSLFCGIYLLTYSMNQYLNIKQFFEQRILADEKFAAFLREDNNETHSQSQESTYDYLKNEQNIQK